MPRTANIISVPIRLAIVCGNTWLRDNATESLTHAQEAGEMIMRLHKRPALGIAALPTAAQHD
jgi:hypothetical protein